MTKEQAIKEFEAVIKDYRWTHDKDPAMIKMYAADRRDFRKVLSLYRKGKYKEAGEVAGHMDTAPREHIPQKVWDDINGY